MAKKTPARKTASGARKRAGGVRARGKAARRAGPARKKVASRKKKVASRRPAAAIRKTARGGRKSASAGRKAASAARKTVRKAVPSRKSSAKAARPATARRLGRAAKPVKSARPATKPTRRARGGGNGDERTLDQTPETGRSVTGRTNPMRTKRSTGTAAGAGDTRHAPGLERARRHLREVEEHVQGPPSSLDLDRSASAARSGRRELQEARRNHTETSPVMTAGDVDADWEDAYSVGDEAPGGDNPTPDQDRVDDIGKALGVEYEDNEELKASEKITERDRHRWELDPASAEDYPDKD